MRHEPARTSGVVSLEESFVFAELDEMVVLRRLCCSGALLCLFPEVLWPVQLKEHMNCEQNYRDERGDCRLGYHNT